MERYAWKAHVREGMLPEYIRRHDEIWPEMKEMFREAQISNYSIWNVGNEIFGYYECESVEKADRIQSESPINARWDLYMKDIIDAEDDAPTLGFDKATQVFLFD